MLSLKINAWSLTEKTNDAHFAALTGLIQLEYGALKQVQAFRRLVYFAAKRVSGTCTAWILLCIKLDYLSSFGLNHITWAGNSAKIPQHKYLQTGYSSVKDFQFLNL